MGKYENFSKFPFLWCHKKLLQLFPATTKLMLQLNFFVDLDHVGADAQLQKI